MIREKYQYSGYTNIVGHAVVSDVPTIKARFLKKCFAPGAKCPADPSDADAAIEAPLSTKNIFLPEGDRRFAKARHLEPAVYTDPSQAVSQVHVCRDRYFDAERDHIKRFQRGDYDGDFPIGANEAEGERGGLESLLAALGKGGLGKRRGSFTFLPRMDPDQLFGPDGEPIYDVAYEEGLGEGQSRHILRDMERRHRSHQAVIDAYKAEQMRAEAESFRRRRQVEEEDELDRLKRRLKKSSQNLEAAKADVADNEGFHEQMERMKKLLGKGRGFGGDTMGDEFMDQGGDQHRALVEEYNRLFNNNNNGDGDASSSSYNNGGKGGGPKQKLYNALHYSAIVDDAEMPMRAAPDNHFVCPCCGGNHGCNNTNTNTNNGGAYTNKQNSNGRSFLDDEITRTHDPRHVQGEELAVLAIQNEKKAFAAAIGGPTRRAEAMAKVVAEEKALKVAAEKLAFEQHEAHIFTVAKTPSELLREKAELLAVANEIEEMIRIRTRQQREKGERRVSSACDEKKGEAVDASNETHHLLRPSSSAAAFRGRVLKGLVLGDANTSTNSNSNGGISHRPTAIAALSGMALTKAKTAAPPILSLAPFAGGDIAARSGNSGASDPRRPLLTLPPPHYTNEAGEEVEGVNAAAEEEFLRHHGGPIAYYERILDRGEGGGAVNPSSSLFVHDRSATAVANDSSALLSVSSPTKTPIAVPERDLTPSERREAEEHLDTLMAIAAEEAAGNVPGLRVTDRPSAVEYTQARARHRLMFERSNPDYFNKLFAEAFGVKAPTTSSTSSTSTTSTATAPKQEEVHVEKGPSQQSLAPRASSSAVVVPSSSFPLSSISASASAAAVGFASSTVPLSTTAQLVGRGADAAVNGNGPSNNSLYNVNAPRDLKLSVATTSINCKTVPGKPGRGRTIVLNVI